jgi:hypothetical protein
VEKWIDLKADWFTRLPRGENVPPLGYRPDERSIEPHAASRGTLVALLRNRRMAENDLSIGGMMGRDSVSREAMSFGRLPE